MFTKKQKKFFGFIFIAVALSFLLPIPDPLDLITFSLFASYQGVDLDASNISLYYFDYFILTLVLGVIFLILGMNLLGMTWKQLWKKIDPGKYKIALMIAFGTVLSIALLDIFSANSGVFGSLLDYTNGNFGVEGWWNLFYKFVLVIFAIPAIAYYFLVKQDKSESLGIFLFSFILYWGGLADLFYFILQKTNIPSELPWLINSPFINFVSTNIMGLSTVTNISLMVSVALSIIIAIITAKILKEKF